MWRSDLVPGLHRFFQGVNYQTSLNGWERVQWGQSREAVQRMYVEARESGGNLVLDSGGEQQRGYEITFGFNRSHQLDSVRLSFAGSGETADFSAIASEISARLGAPMAQTETTTTWQRDDNQVSLSRLPDGSLLMSEIA